MIRASLIGVRTRSLRGMGRSMLLLWVALGVIALSLAWMPSVDRTQEGRVLETARQMQGSGVHGRLVPMLNGHPRLQKPPLAYWLADASYNLSGHISAGTGRVPFVLAAWLTAGLNLLIGTRLFGPRAGLVAMCGIFGCMLTARYGLLAETDVLTMLGVTAAIYATWRGAEAAIARVDSTVNPTLPAVASSSAALHFQFAAIATALTILAKGPQGVFPVLFLIAWAAYRRRWSPIVGWILSAAPLTLLAIAAPWFVYIFKTVDYEAIMYEVRVASLGGAHQPLFLVYFGYIPLDALPFTGFVLAGFWLAVRRVRRDDRLAGLLLWVLVILVPLCIARQRQRHYLMPLMPPLMLLAGWFVEVALRAARGKSAALLRGLVLWTGIALTAAGIGLPVAGQIARHSIRAGDVAAAAMLIAVGVGVVFTLRRHGIVRATYVLMGASAAAVLILQCAWAPTLQTASPRVIAREVAQRFGDRPIRLIGRESLAMMFELRTAPVALTTPAEVDAVLAADPRTIFAERRAKRELSQAPPTLVERMIFTDDGDIVGIFEAK